MPSFPKPKFPFPYDVADEIQRLRAHKAARGVPAKAADRLLLATWNIANFGAQERRDQDRRLIAEILGYFDIAAIQETKENFGDLFDVAHRLGPKYRVLMSDVAGNNERMAFVYDSTKLEPLLEKIGEIALPPKDLENIKLPGITRKFQGFDRTPYLATWSAGRMSILLVNVHLFYGSEKKADVERRALETFAVARWAHQREKSRFAFTRDVIVLGDMNMPKAEPGDPIFKALTKLGLEVPDHTSKVGSSIVDDHAYDQIAFFPGATRADFTGRKGVFDFDQVIFPALWQSRGEKDFNAYVRYYISDHRPMWAEFRIA
jgi:endonuclease/exonuclease/phosphatase family metal-dependent hydrolase